MQTEHLRLIYQGECRNIVLEGLQGAFLGDLVDARLGQLVAVIQDVCCVVFLEDGYEADAVPVVSDTPSIVDMAGHI
jgi:hypothetical protein